MIKPLLSIIIVTYNSADFLTKCLKSILADKKLNFDFKSAKSKAEFLIPAEIIIIDNHSQDKTAKVLKKYPQIHSRLNPKNTGFAAANNQAADIAQGNYLLFLNPDTIILHSAISQSLDWLAGHPEAVATTVQFLNPNKSIQANGGYFPNLLNLLTWSFSLDDLPLINTLVKPFHPHPPQFYTHEKFYLTDHPQDWITGAFLLVRRPAFDKIKGWNQDYFMYGEDYELCYRLKLAFPQSLIQYLIGPQIIHSGQASDDNLKYLHREYQGMLSFFKQHRPRWQSTPARFLLKINCYSHLLISLIQNQTAKAKQYRRLAKDL